MVLLYTDQWDPMLLFAASMTMLEMAVLAAFAILFAVLTKPILGSLMTLAVFVVGHMSADLWMLTRQLPGAMTRAVVAVVYYLVPNLERFDFRTEVVHDLPIPAPAVGWAVVYAAAFVAVVLFLGGWDGPTFDQWLPGIIVTFLPLFWFLLKTAAVVFVFFWIRATWPRFRYDQLMTLGWKRLIPAALVWLIASTVVVSVRQFGWPWA